MWFPLWHPYAAGEEALTIFVDKRKLSKKAEVSDYSGNSSAVTLEALHQLAASYFIDRESTLRKLHHIQIASTAIKVEWGDEPPEAAGYSVLSTAVGCFYCYYKNGYHGLLNTIKKISTHGCIKYIKKWHNSSAKHCCSSMMQNAKQHRLGYFEIGSTLIYKILIVMQLHVWILQQLLDNQNQGPKISILIRNVDQHWHCFEK